MKVKFLVDEDIANYYKTSMFIGFPHCSFKCDHECGKPICQNSELAHEPDIDISIKSIVQRYVNNPLTHAIVLGGLEPFDDYKDLYELIRLLRAATNDDIVIYTGYNEDEIKSQVDRLIDYQNIIIKYGRFVPNQNAHFDSILKIDLASDNQYSKHYVGLNIKDSRYD